MGPCQVSLSLTGLTETTDYTGDLFSVVFDGLSQDLAAEVEISQVVMRQRPNAPISVVAGAPDRLQVDGTLPTFSASFPPDTCLNAAFDVDVVLGRQPAGGRRGLPPGCRQLDRAGHGPDGHAS
jgi:hypothetical protein